MTRDIALVDELLTALDDVDNRSGAHQALERITLLSPPQAKESGRAVWESLIPENRNSIKIAVRSRLNEIGLLSKKGGVRLRQCYSALRNSADPVLIAAKHLLEQVHPGRTNNPRWNRRDLLWHWGRKLRLR
jgi:hypothetical protein